jgi:hypothetical protein
MNSISGLIFKKTIVIMIFTVLFALPFQSWVMDAEGLETSANTEIFIRIHNWNSVSVNNSEETVEITDVPIKKIREQVDLLGDGNGHVETWEVLGYSEGLENQLNIEFSENQDKDTHIFQMLIDGYYGTFNRTSVYFEGLEGLATSTQSVIFAIEIFLDYKQTDTTDSTHKIQINIGEIFEEELSFFKDIKLELPDKWAFNNSVIPPDFPTLFYDQDSLLNVTRELYSDHFAVGEFLRMNGLEIEKESTTPIVNPPPPGPDKNDSDEDGFFTLWTILIIVAVVAVVAVVLVMMVQRKK